jgi:cyanate permease
MEAGRNEGDGPAGRSATDAVRQPMFWLLAAAFVASSFVTSALAVHQIAYLVDSGHGPAFAAAATGALGAMQVPGRLLFAPLERWLSRRTVTVVVFALLAGGVALLSVTTATAAVWIFVGLYGMGRGMNTLLRATLVGDLYGAAHYGSISGVLSALVTGATASGPLAAGVLFDVTGSYGVLLPVLVGIAVLATALAALIERPGWPARTEPVVV